VREALTLSPDQVVQSPSVVDVLALLRELCRPEQVSPDAGGVWITVRGEATTPPQGWKLHVSATCNSVDAVLRATLPILVAAGVTCKVATFPTLVALNAGGHGLAQIGKVITAYPANDRQSVELAIELDAATRGLAGPVVPSDRPLRPGSLVHYRYGAFQMVPMQTKDRGVLPGLRLPDGTLIHDDRSPLYRVPAGIDDLFASAGFTTVQSLKALIGGRYLITSTLHVSARGSVHTVLDTATFSPRVVKRAARHAVVGVGQRDAQDRLRMEFAILTRLAGDPCVPAVHDLIEQDGELFLVMDDIAGPTLSQTVEEMKGAGSLPTTEGVIAWGRELAAGVQRIHDAGYVLCDLKPSNILVTATGALRIIDFDIAQPLNGTRIDRAGTRGYLAPEVRDNLAFDVRADIYSFGAVLYFLVTGAEPELAPDPERLLQRSPSRLNPAVPRRLAGVIRSCLDPRPDNRPRSMLQVDALLAAIPRAAAPMHRDAATRARDPIPTVKRLTAAICRAAQAEHAGADWDSPMADRMSQRTLYDGTAGVLLALAEIVEVLGDPHARSTLSETVSRFASTPPPDGESGAGLYGGEGGVALALLRCGQVLADDRCIARAVDVGRTVASLAHEVPDLIVGSAGRVRANLQLWSGTGLSEFLDAAIAAGAHLVETAQEVGDGLRWLDASIPRDALPQEHSQGSQPRAWLGYAHGAAGIGDVLLDLWEVTGEVRFRRAAEGAARRLVECAVPVLPDGDGLNWPRTEGAPPEPGFWCHGSAGIGRFFLHAAALGLLPDAEEVAHGAARAVAGSTRWAGPTLCHGLAGNLAFLGRMERETGNRGYRHDIASFECLLRTWLQTRDGLLVSVGGEPDAVTPSYMTGYAGVAVALLCHATGRDLPDLARPWTASPVASS
jgi:hypothetical protein